MKNVLSFLGAVFGTALMYSVLSCLTALIFCLEYKEVVQNPGMLFLGGIIALTGGVHLGIAIDESDF
jgi:hypothetical protein